MLALLLALAMPEGQQASPASGGQSPHLSLSPAGEAAFRQYMTTEDPKLVALVKQLQGVQVQMEAISRAPKVDMVKLEALVHRQEQLEASLKAGSNARTLAMLKAMSDSDRSTYLRAVAEANHSPNRTQGGKH
jgi:hypothetical protein